MLNFDRIQEYLFTKLYSQAGDANDGIFDEYFFDEAKQVVLSSSIIMRNRLTRDLSIHRVVSQEAHACSHDLFVNFRPAIIHVYGA